MQGANIAVSLRNSRILPFVTIGMKLENIVLSEIKQIGKKYRIISFYVGSKKKGEHREAEKNGGVREMGRSWPKFELRRMSGPDSQRTAY